MSLSGLVSVYFLARNVLCKTCYLLLGQTDFLTGELQALVFCSKRSARTSAGLHSLSLVQFGWLCVTEQFTNSSDSNDSLKVDFYSVEFSEQAEIPLFAKENVALTLNR